MAAYDEISSSQLIGVDYFSEMVEQEKVNVERNHLEKRIQIKQGDMHQLPFDDNNVDLIFGRSVIHHWADPVKAYQKMYRVLKTHGVCIIHEPSRTLAPETLLQFNLMRQEFGIGPMNQEEKYTAEEVVEQMKLAGLELDSQVSLGKGVASLGFEVRLQKRAE